MSICMGHSGGLGSSYVMVHSRWIKVAGDSRRTGGEPCCDREHYSVFLVFLDGADLLCLCDKVMLCESSSEYSETDIHVY